MCARAPLCCKYTLPLVYFEKRFHRRSQIMFLTPGNHLLSSSSIFFSEKPKLQYARASSLPDIPKIVPALYLNTSQVG